MPPPPSATPATSPSARAERDERDADRDRRGLGQHQPRALDRVGEHEREDAVLLLAGGRAAARR